MFRCAKGGSDGIRSGFLGCVAKRRWGGPGGGDGEKVNELIVVGPFWTSPLQVFRRDGDGDSVVVTISTGGDI